MDDTIVPVRLPPLPLPGGCQCGAVRYRLTAVPLTYYLCHCSRCQRQSGSAFGQSMMLPAGGIEIEGPLVSFEWRGGSGRLSDHSFCRDCGCRIIHRVRGSDRLVLKPGTLDDTAWLRPAGHMFAATPRPALGLSFAGGLVYDDTPDVPALCARWSRMLEAGRAGTEER